MLLLKQQRAPKTAAAVAVAFRLAINARWGGKVIKTLNEHFETTQFGAIYEWQYTIYCNWAFKLKWTKQHSAVRSSQGCLFCQILFRWFSFIKQFSQTIQMYWTLHHSLSYTCSPRIYLNGKSLSFLIGVPIKGINLVAAVWLYDTAIGSSIKWIELRWLAMGLTESSQLLCQVCCTSHPKRRGGMDKTCNTTTAPSRYSR